MVGPSVPISCCRSPVQHSCMHFVPIQFGEPTCSAVHWLNIPVMSEYFIAAVGLLLFPTDVVNGDQLVLQCVNTPDIVIPRFNPALGDLVSVQLQIQMQSGQTSASGNHVWDENVEFW